MPAEAAQRIVPGAPPVTSLSKAQKKKRRAVKKDGEDEPTTPTAHPVEIPDTHAAALTEKAPEEADIKTGAVAEVLVAQPEPPKEETEDTFAVKPSPVVDLLNKRLKALGKKITRIHTYSSKPTAELNDDQKKTLATLPSLEAVRKELEETKKAVEVLEAENAVEAARRQAEFEEVKRQRIADTLAAAQKAHTVRTAQILDFIRLHSSLSNSEPSVQALNLAEDEIRAIYASANALLSQEAESKHGVVSGFLLGEGDVEGVSYIRLIEIVDAFMNPPIPEETPAETEDVAQAVFDSAAVETTAAEPEQVIGGILPSGAGGISGGTGAMNFRFMQESELDSEPVSFENGAEWVEREDAAETPTQVEPPVDLNGAYTADEVTEAQLHVAPTNGALDWADDEGGLPSIDGLHASFGTSGSATPTAEPAPVESQKAWTSATVAESSELPTVNAASSGPSQPSADDGFTQAKGGRGRGRARGFRGGERGGERGAFRGGERGGFRGERGGFRGGDRGGFRGGERGGERGGRGRSQQDGESGSWRGGSDGEHRGRGRGRGRGGFDRDRGARGGGIATSDQPATQE
ncbi:hypothetical protein M0805_001684 [Coniferiporia weirii]|nr:hypothetical protein M0805_001684 [Coniferiporia weirii]